MRRQRQWVTQQKEIARLEEAIRRFKDWAHRVVDERHIKQARNKQRQIDRMDKVERPVFERRKMGLELRSAARGGDRVIELRGVDFDPVLIDVSLTIMRGKRVGIIGPNGPSGR
jgi:ATP-binding cassette subfamily F protein 3